MRLPAARGPVSGTLVEALRGAPGPLPVVPDLPALAALPASAGDALRDEDLQLTLYICYELHYRGFDGVAAEWEWEPSLLALRAAAERPFEAALRDLVDLPAGAVGPDTIPDALAALVEADDGPRLAQYLASSADLTQFREFVVHRSIYHLKEADPHTWGIPRLEGPAKAALVEIQIDEYGGGRLDRMHAELFRTTMAALGLATDYGSYVDTVPALTLATNNMMSLFGLHRRLVGALLGHLAAFEMTSSLPNRRYGNGLRRLGGNPTATRFYDEHVAADAVHEQIAAYDLCGSYAKAEPDRAGDVLFGAACCLAVDRLLATHMLDCWDRNLSSLRPR